MRLAYKQPSFSRYVYSGEDQCLSPVGREESAVCIRPPDPIAQTARGEREASQRQGVVRKKSSPCHAPGDAEEGLVVLAHDAPKDRVLASRYHAPQMINPMLN